MRNKLAQSRARKLRNQPTDAERLLWQHLRVKQLGGYRFRRQFPIGQYIADFACIEAQLVIELDGGQHQENATSDAVCDMRIGDKGFRVLRFWNNQVFEETDAVLEVVLLELQHRCPHPVLPPQAEEGT